jgi:hypothetical protein
MWRYVQRDDVILLTMEFEFGRIVAFVAIKDQQPVFAFRTRRRVVAEVLDLVKAYCIGSPAIFWWLRYASRLGGCIWCTS